MCYDYFYEACLRMEIKRGLTQEPDLFAIKQKAKRRGPEFIGKPLRRVLKQADLNCGMSTNAILSSVVRACGKGENNLI